MMSETPFLGDSGSRSYSQMMNSPRRQTVAGILTIAALALPVASTASPADAAAKYHYANCTKLHHDFKHGVGKKHAKDHHSKSSSAVKNFKHSTKIFKAAVAYNADLDRDHDGIACEKH